MKQLFLVLAMGVVIMSCKKKNDDVAPYLNFSQTTLSLAPVPGATAAIIVESNIDWQVSILAGADWLQVSKTTGNGNDTIHISVIKDNDATQARTASVTAIPANASINLQAQVTVEQKPYNVQLVSQKTFGGTGEEYIESMVPTADGGLFLVGSTTSDKTDDVGTNHGASDAWMIRLNSNRDTVWTRVMGGNSYESAEDAIATSDGGFVVVGSAQSNKTGDVGTSNGYSDWWIIKLKSNGDTAWTRMLGGANYDYAKSIAATADGGFIVGGQIYSSGLSTASDVVIVKYNSNGNIVWQKTFGGSQIDVVTDVSVASNGTIWVAAWTLSNNSGSVGINHGSWDAWIIKLKDNGDMEWNKLLGGSKSDVAFVITNTTDGGCIISGNTMSSETGDVIGKNQGLEDMWTVKLNAGGTIEWKTMLGGTGYDGGNGIAATADGGYLITGYTSSTDGDVGATKGDYDLWIVKLNSSGQKIWSKTLGGSLDEAGRNILLNADGSFLIGGYTASNNSGDVGATRGTTDGWLLKLKDY